MQEGEDFAVRNGAGEGGVKALALLEGVCQDGQDGNGGDEGRGEGGKAEAANLSALGEDRGGGQAGGEAVGAGVEVTGLCAAAAFE